MRLRGRVDGNHTAIVAALRGCGCLVLSLAGVGGGVPDLLVCRRGRLQLLELKDGRQRPSARRLRESQVAFAQAWPVTVVTSVDEALRAVGVMPGARRSAS